MVEILQKDNPRLRGQAKAVPIKDIGTKKIVQIIADMKNAMYAEKDGIAIAAPQIGVPLQIFVVSGRLFYLNKEDRGENPEKEKEYRTRDMVFINPMITKHSRKKKTEIEGCLSVRWLYGKTLRYTQVTLRAHDEHGTLIERGASGLLAQIFQHETDHLHGILFTDHAKDIEEMHPDVHVK